jgi:hypothetical protein
MIDRFAFRIALALLAVSLGGCSKQLHVETEYAEGTDFCQYQTYRWITDDLVLIQSGTGNERIRNVENERRIRAAVDRELADKGLHKAEGDDAQLIVAFTLGTKVRYHIQGGAFYDIATAPSAAYTRGVLTIYLFDRASGQQIWSASTRKDLEPGDDPDAVINVAVNVLLTEFPPTQPSASSSR